MIAFWNRREVYTGFSGPKCAEVRSTLAARGIGYSHRLVSHANSTFFVSSRARGGGYGVNQDFSIQYYVYVHKNDCDRAVKALREAGICEQKNR